MMPSRPVVVHGAGSSPAVAQAVFPGARSFWLAGHGPAPFPGDDLGRLAALVAEVEPDLVAGISYGAHLVARWAAAGLPPCVEALALVLPAWTGTPGLVAAATLAQAEAFEAVGVDAELARVVAAYPGWVSGALAASWPEHDDRRISAALRAVAAAPGPSALELAAIDVPVAVVALTDDPLHPAAVAREWAALLPDGRLAEVDATGLRDLGEAATSVL